MANAEVFATIQPNVDRQIPIPGIRAVAALVDTGATESCNDSRLAAQLNLPIVDRRQIGGVGGVHMVNIHLAQVHVAVLGKTAYGTFAAVHLADGGQPHVALIGRTFLQHFTMVYEGRTGTVIITDDAP
jgi:predicted aspartyl protease